MRVEKIQDIMRVFIVAQSVYSGESRSGIVMVLSIKQSFYLALKEPRKESDTVRNCLPSI